MTDPTRVYSAHCATCDRFVSDSEFLDSEGDCPSCVAEREEEDE